MVAFATQQKKKNLKTKKQTTSHYCFLPYIYYSKSVTDQSSLSFFFFHYHLKSQEGHRTEQLV